MPQSKILNIQVISIFGICLLLGTCKQSAPPKTQTLPTVSIEELLADPQSHAHTMVRVSGCCLVGLESVTLRPCNEPREAIWIEDMKFVQAMENRRLPDMPDAIPKGLEKPAIEKELFAYDEKRNAAAWEKLQPSENRKPTVLEVVLLGQFDTAAVPVMGQTAFGHLGAYSHQLILADVFSSKPVRFSTDKKETQSSKAIETTVCEVVGDALRFVGERVRFSARFVSDGRHGSVLIDSNCGRGIEPFVADEVEQHPDIQALDRALGKGMLGTMDRRITATFTGRFVVRDSYSSWLQYALEIERIDDLKVTLVDLKPHVPR